MTNVYGLDTKITTAQLENLDLPATLPIFGDRVIVSLEASLTVSTWGDSGKDVSVWLDAVTAEGNPISAMFDDLVDESLSDTTLAYAAPLRSIPEDIKTSILLATDIDLSEFI